MWTKIVFSLLLLFRTVFGSDSIIGSEAWCRNEGCLTKRKWQVGFVGPHPAWRCGHFGGSPHSKTKELSARKEENDDGENFFEKLLKNAFSNDETLSRTDGVKGQLDNGIDSFSSSQPKTEVQKRWLEAERLREEASRKTRVNQSQGQRQTKGVATPVPAARLVGTTWEFQLYLAGIPKDQDAPKAPEVKTPTLDVTIAFLDNSTFQVLNSSATDFIEQEYGTWTNLNDSGNVVFSLDVTGYSRTIQTTGTRSGVSWSRMQREAQTQRTQTTYIVPAGPLWLCLGQVQYGSKPGTLEISQQGLLQVERRAGLLGKQWADCGFITSRQLATPDSDSLSSSSSPTDTTATAK